MLPQHQQTYWFVCFLLTNSKQRQLNIAVRRIEMAAIEQERIAKERRVMNWERLFARLQVNGTVSNFSSFFFHFQRERNTHAAGLRRSDKFT